MNNGIFCFPKPRNEPTKNYAPGSVERKLMRKELSRQEKIKVEIPVIIGGKEVRTGKIREVTMPCDHGHVLAIYHEAGPKETELAIKEALLAKKEWESLHWTERCAVMLKVAELISNKYRYLLNAATMLGQAKNVHQAEIDAACESIDFLRFGAYQASYIYQWQPLQPHEYDCVNKMEYRPLEGFVLTISPFNFTAIALSLNSSVITMGNTTIWKPARTSLLSSYYLMKIFEEAGLPPGVINFLPGPGSEISEVALRNTNFAGLHFTGSTDTFNTLWKKLGENISKYKNYPRIVGETGGKDFIFAHYSADIHALATALVRGAFEYQGQKCSAASRAYIPKSIWKKLREILVDWTKNLSVGDVRDFKNFVNAVIDEASYKKIMGYIEKAKTSPNAKIIVGGNGDKRTGYYVEPTIIETNDPNFVTMNEEIFGPVLTIFVYEDERFEETLTLCDSTSSYGLTGSIFAKDRKAVEKAAKILRYAAGNFYINDKPTGAVVCQQPFGGARASGTNDKAGTYLNLIRWISPRTIKENLNPPTHWSYPFLEK
ncbi:L-glutamate gamma-semialdehyde dehydrogenase [Thermovirga lienii]|jgi:1-pyrroline-5-carboxylate dehydrogenase|uniref:L-glutamate gamma-semialdehyde dehydrogenase n=1 Tax=Thermovirga lienii TaxID=336261 RepID=UPI000ECBB63D|nr:1-pyrroline-5-carboxylate dehydrogenase [Thermovirga sp.]HCD72533.1 1-pyrroline-5-carboxylate dehydrogenase [Thermovirga lienii]